MATFRSVVTGSSSGIGRATALLFARDGHSLVLTSRREEELARLADACLSAGAASVSVVAGDIGDPDLATGLVESAKGSGEGELVLVNNAGQAVFGPFHEQRLETCLRTVEVGLLGAIRATHALLPLMLEQGRGTVVNVLSVAASHAFPNAECYTAAKAGLQGFSRSLATSYRSQGVRVCAVTPGATDTPLWDDASLHPERRDMLTAQAVAETILFVVGSPRDRAIDEIAVMPPKGIL